MPDADLRRALDHIRPYWPRLAVVLVLSLTGTALSLVLPWLSKALVDDALLARDAAALVRIVAAFGAITLASFLLNVASGLRYTRVSAEILFDMRLVLYRHLHRLSPRFWSAMALGQIVSRINSDIGEIQRVISEAALAWVGSVLFLVGTVVMLAVLDLRLFLVSLIVLPPAVWALVRYRRRLEAAVAVMRDRSAAIGTFLIETLQGVRLVTGANAQEREAARFRMQNDSFIDSLMAMRRLTYLSGGLPGLFLAAGSALVFMYGGWRVIDGTLTMGTLVAFIAYQMRLLGPVQGLMGLYANLATARVSLRRVHEILDVPVDVVEADDALSLRDVRGRITFDDVFFTFGRGGAILRGVSLEVQPGEVVAIAGPSGGGKSTIADLLVRQLDPDAGRVLLDGHDLRAVRLEDVRRHIVVVEQEPFVLNASLAENIRYARPDANGAEVRVAARAAGLDDLIERLPQGLDTPVGERGRALSAGERQRLAIARAFLANPSVLVLDEATGSLDPATEQQVIHGYEAVMRGRTTVVITHRAGLAMRADRVIVLDDGHVVEEGPARTLLARNGALRALFAQDASRARSSTTAG
ncbi:MAG: ABC transporter ATP-binding protein/permease [Gemmatimonadetes bacterium]|nr:ABC transporter ATP-binding protein/permease [Gemmatimonadota bacterium]